MHQLPCDEVKVLNVLLNSKQSSTEVSSKKHTAVLTVSLLHGDTEEKCTTAAVKGKNTNLQLQLVFILQICVNLKMLTHKM